MLKNVKNISRDPPGQSLSDKDIPLIPDPWDCSDLGSPTQPPPQHGKFPIESHPSLAPASNPDTLLIQSTPLSPLRVLLQDWLKLGVHGGKALSIHLQEAIALLYWQATIPTPDAMVNS
jgi:hypothetical protein